MIDPHVKVFLNKKKLKLKEELDKLLGSLEIQQQDYSKQSNKVHLLKKQITLIEDMIN